MFRARTSRILLGSAVLCLTALPVRAQESVSSLLGQVERALETAQAAGADILAPGNYARAMKHYRDAQSKREQGKSTDDISKELNQSLPYFQRATEASRQAHVTLADQIRARSDAQKVQAEARAAETWQRAERKFAEAAGKLEGGDANGARDRGAEATPLYRSAELQAIKVDLLGAARVSLTEAERAKAKDLAPKTLASAAEYLNRADSEITNQRYENETARGFARQAHYEARHALHLAKTVKLVKDGPWSVEDLLLDGERPLRQIATRIELPAEFDQGWQPTTAAILAKLDRMEQDRRKLEEELRQKTERVADLEMQVEGLERTLGGATAEQMELRSRIEEQAAIREKFRRVESMFHPEEARVFREGDDVYIRLLALTFDVGMSDIKPEHDSLLAQVREAIELFPYSTVTVEGHTDSYGSDRVNMELSQERAIAVGQYLIDHASLPAEDVDAVGYGESRPIANNETAAGRAQNRRIDIVIHTTIAR